MAFSSALLARCFGGVGVGVGVGVGGKKTQSRVRRERREKREERREIERYPCSRAYLELDLGTLRVPDLLLEPPHGVLSLDLCVSRGVESFPQSGSLSFLGFLSGEEGVCPDGKSLW